MLRTLPLRDVSWSVVVRDRVHLHMNGFQFHTETHKLHETLDNEKDLSVSNFISASSPTLQINADDSYNKINIVVVVESKYLRVFLPCHQSVV
jgi:hypothetical protein